MRVLDFSGFVKLYESQNQIEAGIVGDSSVNLYTDLVPQLKTFDGLNKGGWRVPQLLEATENYRRTHPEVNLLFIGIGSNDLYIVNNQAIKNVGKLKEELGRIFPNAKFIVVKGGWGWGALIDGENSPVKGYTGSSDPQAMKDYYQRVWEDNGFKVMETSQGYSPVHHQSNTRGIKDQANQIQGILQGREDIYTVPGQAPKEPLSERDLTQFYDVLQGIVNDQRALSQQSSGAYSFLPEVEALQVALDFLGYNLPVYGVDGLYGPETAESVRKFKSDYQLPTQGNTFDAGDSIALMQALKDKGFSVEDLEKTWKKSYQMAASGGGDLGDLTTGGDMDFLYYMPHQQGPGGGPALINAYLGKGELHPATAANNAEYLTSNIYKNEDLKSQIIQAVNSGDHRRAAALFLGYQKGLFNKKKEEVMKLINQPKYAEVKAAIDSVPTQLPKEFLYTVANVESGLNPKSYSSSSPYMGLYAVTRDAVKKQIGPEGDPLNVNHNALTGIRNLEEGVGYLKRAVSSSDLAGLMGNSAEFSNIA